MFPAVDSSALPGRPKKRIRSSVNLHSALPPPSRATYYAPISLLPDELQMFSNTTHCSPRKRPRSDITTSYEDHSQFDFMHPSFPALALAPPAVPVPEPYVSGSFPDDQATTSSITNSSVSREASPTPDDFAAIAAIVDEPSSILAKTLSVPSANTDLSRAYGSGSANFTNNNFECAHRGCEHQTFSSRSDLLAHNRVVHKGKKRHMCKYCPKSFGHSGHLNRHTESVHLQRRRHKCGLCGDAFFQASHLQSHINHVHKRRKPWECTECHLKLTTENGLRNHLRNLHKAQPKHECALCDSKFILKNDLSRHVRRCHPESGHI